jgi:hypothetical protein
VILHGPMYLLLQDRFPFMTAGLFYCGIRVESLGTTNPARLSAKGAQESVFGTANLQEFPKCSLKLQCSQPMKKVSRLYGR